MIRHWDKESGDLATGAGFLTGKESTGASIYHRLRMFFGEFFLDVTDGTPWFQSILGKRAQDTAEFAIKQRIVTSPGVVQITRFFFDFDRNTRRITVDCSVLDVNNEVIEILFDEEII